MLDLHDRQAQSGAHGVIGPIRSVQVACAPWFGLLAHLI